MKLFKSYLLVPILLIAALAGTSHAQDPLGINGIYNLPPVNGVIIAVTVEVVGSGGGAYAVLLNEDVTVPVIGCKGVKGDVLVQLSSTGGTTFTATSFFYELKPFGAPGPRGDFCVLDQKNPKPVNLIKQSNGVLLDYIAAADVDQFFQLATPITPSDTQVPTVVAKKASGKAGKKIKLKYDVSDNSGSTGEVVQVYQGKKLVATIVQPIGPRVAGVINFVSWKAPAKGAGKKFTFIVTSTDAAGNIGVSAKKAVTVS